MAWTNFAITIGEIYSKMERSRERTQKTRTIEYIQALSTTDASGNIDLDLAPSHSPTVPPLPFTLQPTVYQNSRRRLHLLSHAPRRAAGRGAAPAEREDHQGVDRGGGGQREKRGGGGGRGERQRRREQASSSSSSSGRGRPSEAGFALFLGSEQG